MFLKRSSWLLMVAVGGVGGMVACSSGDEVATPAPAPSSSDEAQATLGERSEALSREASDVVVVSANRLVFPATMTALLAKKPGDILVGDRQQAGALGHNPDGFLRKVRSVRQVGAQIVIETTPAALDEAMSHLSIHTRVRGPALTADGPAVRSLEPGLDPQGGKKIQVLNFTGKNIFDVNESTMLDGKSISFHAFAKVKTGVLDFTPDYDIDTDIEPPGFSLSDGFKAPKVNKVSVAAIGKLDAELVINAGIKLDSDIDAATFSKLVAQKILKAKSATLADYKFDLGSIKAGPISVPLNGSFKAELQCNFDWKGGIEVDVGGKANASLKLGLKYENSDFSPIFEKSATFEKIGPDVKEAEGHVRVKCSIQPTLEVKLWDVGMAQVWAKAYAGMGSELTCSGPSGGTQTGTVSGEAVAGVRAGVKAKLNLLGLVKYDKECTLFDVQEKGSFTKTFTLPGNGSATCDGNGAMPFELEEAPAPEKCFGNGGGSSGSGGGSGSGDKCGNGTLDFGEVCDGSLLGTSSCVDLTQNPDAKGNPTCKSDCTLDKSTCDVGATCGDVCTVSDKPQKDSCGDCQKKVCAVDDFCCNNAWDAVCISQVEKQCGQKCQQGN